MLGHTCREVLVQGGVNFLGQNWLMRWGREVTDALPSGAEIAKGIGEKAPNSVLDLEKTSVKSQRTSPSSSTAKRAQTVKVGCNRAQM